MRQPIVSGIQAPRRHRVTRPRLWPLIDPGRGGTTVVWGPAGSGKTEAVREWVWCAGALGRGGVLWYDAGDRGHRPDLAGAVVEHLVVGGLAVRTGQGALLPGRGVPGDQRSALVQAAAQLDASWTLVVDRAEQLDATGAGDLCALAREVERLDVVVLLDATAPLAPELAALLTDLDVRSVAAADLALTVEETVQVLSELGAPMPQPYGPAVTKVSGGHAGAIVQIATWLRHAPVPPPPAELAAGWRPDLPAIPAELELLALADAPTAELAERIVGRPDAAAGLDAAEQAGLGIWSPGPGPRRFVWAPHVRVALRHRVEQTRPDAGRGLYADIAAWAAESGQVLEAVRAGLDAGDHELVAEVLRTHLGRLQLARPGVLDPVLDRIDAAAIAACPELVGLAAFVHGTAAERRDDVRAWLSRADEIADPSLRGVADLVAARAAGDLGRTRAAADRIEEVLTAAEPERRLAAALAGEVRREVAVVRAATGDGAGACALLTQLVEAETEHPRRVRARSWLALLRAARGEIGESRRLLAEIEEDAWPDGWWHGPARLPYDAARAWLALECRDPGEARRLLLPWVAEADDAEFWVALAEPLACLVAGWKVTEVAAALRDRAAATAWSAAPAYFSEVAVRCGLVALTDPGRVVEHSSRRQAGAELARARTDLASGALEAADRHLQRVVAAPQPTPRERVELAVLELAVGLRRDGHAAQERATLEALLLAYPLSLPITLLPIDDQRAVAAAMAGARGSQAHEAYPPSHPRWLSATDLSAREIDVLGQLASGLKLSQIARGNYVSLNTVKTQVRSIYRKLGVCSRDEAVRAGELLGLLDAAPALAPSTKSG